VRDCANRGEPFVPDVAQVLETGASSARRGAAQALGRMGGPAAVEALVSVVAAEDGKLRKNAATALGRIGGPVATTTLAARLQSEPLDYVRSAVVLALGRIDSDESVEALLAWSPSVASDEEARRRALGDRLPRPPISFQRDRPWTLPVRLVVPQGLEEVVADEVRSLGVEVAGTLDCSVRLAKGTPPWAVWPAVRGAFAVRAAGKGSPEKAIPALLETLSRSEGATYRLHVDGPRRTRAELRTLLTRLRRLLAPLGITDQPAAYDFQIVLTLQNTFEIEPSFLGDERFDYRKKDVGASIHPVVGASLARLVNTGPDAIVHDPTCGSATLLVERARLGSGPLSGTDISPTALTAATTNVEAAGLKVELKVGDSALIENWPDEVDEVLVNLPFGVRTFGTGEDVTRATVAFTAAKLRPGGRALFFTAQVGIVVDALRETTDLQVVRRLDLDTGGIHVVALVVERR
jgi:HEAT repeat protein/predicted RNA methylase